MPLHGGITSILLLSLIFLGVKSMKVEGGFTIDNIVSDFLVKRRSETRTRLMKLFTFFASLGFVSALSLFLSFYFMKNKDYTNMSLIMVASLGASASNHILKALFGRERPLEIPLINEKFYSFPSGHSMVAMAFYLMIAYILETTFGIQWMIIIYIFAFTLIALIGLSRIYLGVHWFSDVIGGYVGGYCVYYFGRLLVEYFI